MKDINEFLEELEELEQKELEKQKSNIPELVDQEVKVVEEAPLTKEGKVIAFLKELLSLFWHIILAWAVAYLIVNFVGTLSIVDGSSMYDTLEDGEHLWIDKLSYTFGEPERFDIVVFPFHSEGEDVYYIKRIIALPNETIYIDEEGQIFIDDVLLEEDYGYETIDVDKRIRAATPITLGEDEYFVMGDNRNNSGDSRYEIVGNISGDELLGKAILRVWPLNAIGLVE
ncbi:MAG: signal peptidase I [Lachnospiraceae bacterium]